MKMMLKVPIIMGSTSDEKHADSLIKLVNDFNSLNTTNIVMEKRVCSAHKYASYLETMMDEYENDDRIEEQIPIDFCNLLEWMKNRSIKNLTFTGKNYFDGIVCKINYNDLLTIKKNYYYNWFNEEAFQFDYIGGADF